jgi:hypothetical protein
MKYENEIEIKDGETKGEKGNYTDLKMGSDFTRSGKRWRCRESG